MPKIEAQKGMVTNITAVYVDDKYGARLCPAVSIKISEGGLKSSRLTRKSQGCSNEIIITPLSKKEKVKKTGVKKHGDFLVKNTMVIGGQ